MFDARSCITVNEAADTIARTAIIQGIFMSFVLNLDFRIAFICVFWLYSKGSDIISG